MVAVYSERLEPLQKGMNHTIPTETERITQVAPGAPYLFKEMGRCPEKIFQTKRLLEIAIVESRPDNYIQIEVDEEGTLRLETGSCRI